LGNAGRGGYRRRRRVTAGGALLGFIMLAILVIAVVALGVVVYRTMHPAEKVDPLAGRSGTTASTSTTLASGSNGTITSTSTSLPVILLRPTAATSSSALKATTTNNFRATNLVDGDVTTAWNEGAKGVGLGEWVRFEFSSPVTLARIDLANGNQKDEQRFSGDIRIKTVQLEYSNGSTQLVDLLDTREIQSINTLREEIDWLKLIIVSVYPDYVWADAALSEVRLYGLANQQ
jgi:hypothetical protein